MRRRQDSPSRSSTGSPTVSASPSPTPRTSFSVTSAADAGCGTTTAGTLETYSGDSGLRYLGDGYWQFNWKTPTTYAGECRIMTLNVRDTAAKTAQFLFR